MKDVTGQMQRFKEASRHIWNSYLMPGEGVLDMAVEDSFLQIERELLRSIVLEGSAAADQYGHSASAGLIVKPSESLDVSVPMDAAFLEQFGPDATLSLKMSSIATRCEVDSESVRVGDLTGRIGDDDHG
ncbi:hypothetical protein [uncultured Stenotrophomonas sp.]|uniref:hypothetical protein n=1 Tax=uncultured Stenotrophomonas sp. TaxID=165438 RepID=UPI0028D49DF1|nr:hypothetical protein [uncultured Stenotrophomonas sp.]